MDPIPFWLLLTTLLCTCFHLLLRPRRAANLPPGPPQLPIVGNIFQFTQNPYRAFANLAKKYGPIMHLKFGSLDTIVISNKELAKQVLQIHDKVLSGRPITDISTIYDHHQRSVLSLPTNAKWRNLKRICRDHMFSPQRLNATQGLRWDKFDKLHKFLQECCEAGRVVDITDVVFTMSVNLVTGSLFSLDFAEFHSNSALEFKGLLHGLVRMSGAVNVSDFFPVLKRLDIQGLKRQSTSLADKISAIFDEVIEKRLKSDSPASNDALESLLEIIKENESEFTRNDLLHLLLDLFVAGVESTAATMEWAMTELILNPKVIGKARNEIHTVIGPNQRVKESDIHKLPYLEAILKETFRFHPPGPLLSTHKAEADTIISGFLVPKNSLILVSAWALGRDSKTWSNPDRFEPERFLGSGIDFYGRNFELIPFGTGRRICPAIGMAHRMVQLTVATLIQDFDWRLEGGIEGEDLNMDDKYEFSMQRVEPLKAIPIKISSM